MSILAPKKSKTASWEKDFLKTSNLSFLAAEKSKLDVLRKGLVARFLAGPGNLPPCCHNIFHIKNGHFQAPVEIKTSKHKRPVDPIVHGEICVHGKIQPKQDAIEKLREQDVERGAAGIMGSFGQI